MNQEIQFSDEMGKMGVSRFPEKCSNVFLEVKLVGQDEMVLTWKFVQFHAYCIEVSHITKQYTVLHVPTNHMMEQHRTRWDGMTWDRSARVSVQVC